MVVVVGREGDRVEGGGLVVGVVFECGKLVV